MLREETAAANPGKELSRLSRLTFPLRDFLGFLTPDEEIQKRLKYYRTSAITPQQWKEIGEAHLGKTLIVKLSDIETNAAIEIKDIKECSISKVMIADLMIKIKDHLHDFARSNYFTDRDINDLRNFKLSPRIVADVGVFYSSSTGITLMSGTFKGQQVDLKRQYSDWNRGGFPPIIGSITEPGKQKHELDPDLAKKLYQKFDNFFSIIRLLHSPVRLEAEIIASLQTYLKELQPKTAKPEWA